MKKCITIITTGKVFAEYHHFIPFEDGGKCKYCNLVLTKEVLKKVRNKDNGGNKWI